jgi:uncharacterized protein YecE (DUF72 family)
VRHALEARHPSFMCTAFLDQLRRHEIAAVFADSDEYPSFADATTDLVYARLMRADATLEAGHSPAAFDAYAKLARTWQQGGEPKEIARVAAPGKKTGARDVYLFFINGAKERAPAAALASRMRAAACSVPVSRVRLRCGSASTARWPRWRRPAVLRPMKPG